MHRLDLGSAVRSTADVEHLDVLPGVEPALQLLRLYLGRHANRLFAGAATSPDGTEGSVAPVITLDVPNRYPEGSGKPIR